MHVLEALRQLRDVDQEWSISGQEYVVLRERLADQSTLQAAQEAQQQRQAALTQTRQKLVSAELELRTTEERLQEANRQLYADGNLSPRELDHLRRDADYLTRRVGELEELVLGLMSGQEEQIAAVERGAAELAALESQASRDNATDLARYRELRAALQALKDRREALRGTLSPQALRLYDDLWRSKQGAPLANLQDGRCQVCRVQVPREKARSVESYEARLVTCDGCGRILIPS
ncbi:MAG: hypothetical protein GXY68_13385 [Chloroflexi bacterium]|jgi:predicted  nucleic acid-binding Zn-ribbon protein|nr:hypothetical protein [Chloroflexota bacterium]